MQDNFSIRNWKNTVLHEDAFNEGVGEVDVYGYRTQHFDMCPAATTLFKNIIAGQYTDGVPSAKEEASVIAMAKLHDALFNMEKKALGYGEVDKSYLDQAERLENEIYRQAQLLDLEDEVKMYIPGHIDKIANVVVNPRDLKENPQKDLDDLFNIILKYTKDPDDAEIELDGYTSQGFNGFSDALAANLQRDMDFQSWVQRTHDEEILDREIGEQDELEDDDIELEIPGETPTVDKKLQAKASRQDVKIKAYKEITAKMKDALEKFKSAEGDAKEVAKEELKALTPEFQAAKKEYEKLKSVKL